MKLKLKSLRPRGNRKLQAKRGRIASRMKDGILHPEPNERKARWRRATGMRIALERKAYLDWFAGFGGMAAEAAAEGLVPLRRWEEGGNLELFKKMEVPTVEELFHDLERQERAA